MSRTSRVDIARPDDRASARIRAATLRIGSALLAAIAAWSTFGVAPGVQAQTAVAVPDNATARRYGAGWTCDRGYRRVGSDCEAVAVPPNAYLSASGDDWECERLFRERDGGCEALLIPANAYAEDRSYGRGWRCEMLALVTRRDRARHAGHLT